MRSRCPSSLTPTRWSWRPCWRPCRPGPTASSPSTVSTRGCSSHSDEYVVVLGPTLTDEEAVVTCEVLRTTAPAISTILAREHLDGELLAARHAAPAPATSCTTADTASITEALGRAFELFVALRGPAGAMHMSKVIAVFSPKGGVGKTTISVNLALALTEKGARRVCLVDLDLAFGDVAITMQLFPTHSIEQAIGSEDALDVEMLDGAAHPAPGLAHGARRSPAPGHPRAGHARCWSRGSSAPCGRPSTTSSSTPRRPSTSRCSPRSTRPTRSSWSPRSTYRR